MSNPIDARARQRGPMRLAALLLLAFSATVFALGLDEAKTQGLVGETTDGYLAAVGGDPDAEVSELIKDINRQRRAEYERIADKNDINRSAVEALAGKKAIEKTPSGEYVRVDGQWRRK